MSGATLGKPKGEAHVPFFPSGKTPWPRGLHLLAAFFETDLAIDGGLDDKSNTNTAFG